MWAIGSSRRRASQLLWLGVAVVNLLAVAILPRLDTLPFRLCCVGLAVVYGFGLRGRRSTTLVLALVGFSSGALLFLDLFQGPEGWGELAEGGLIVALFLPLVRYADRRQALLEGTQELALERAQLLEDQERLLQDISHDLRTPVSIARGHLDVLRTARGLRSPELAVALDELERAGHILDRLLLLARAEQPGSVEASNVELEEFLEDVFVRWSELARRGWRLGPLPAGVLRADPHGLRIAVDSLLENAVKYTASSDCIELRARHLGGELAIDVVDGGPGIAPELVDRIFDRFASAAGGQRDGPGGIGLGLAIVDAIARAHGGRCSVDSSAAGTTFSLYLPGFTPEPSASIAYAPRDGARSTPLGS
jgi:signal transduction histidine kinase